jgi:beta-lactamase superfamily II metal-dependent hydrolase
MKKLALSLLALIVILGFSFGCASGHTPTPHPDTLPAATEPPTAPAPSPTLASPPESPSPPTPAQGELKVHFIDVGQGDATLLQGPDFTIVIDAGRHDRSDVVPYLKSAGVKSIDLLIGTHPHADHIGQFPQVIEAFPVGEVWLSGDTTTTRTFESAIDAIEASDAGYHEPRAGETFNFGSARIEVLNPDHLTGELHEGSIGVRIVYGSFTVLFTGDAEAETEMAILARKYDVNALILHLGHHGSSTSSSAEFLKAVNPEVAVYSAAKDNSYGHPHEVVLERLRQMGVQIYGTDVNGTIMVITDGQTYEVQAQRR